MNPSILLDELVERGIVSREVVEKLSQSDHYAGKAIEVALVEQGFVKEDTLLALMSDLFQIPYRHLTPECIDHELAESVPRRLLENFCIIPLKRAPESQTQNLATVDPFDITAADIFRQVTGRQVGYVLAPRAEIESAIQGKLLSSQEFGRLVDALPPPLGWEDVDSLLASSQEELTENSSPIIRLVNSILRDAIRLKASDIHVEPQEDCFRIRYRIDGLLSTAATLPKRAERTCVSRIKILAGLDISDTRCAQDGRISLTAFNSKVNLRVSTVPSTFGEKVVLRVLDQSATKLELPQLGMSSLDLNSLYSHLAASSGMILITGPTGSGKTSTLYAALRVLNKESTNVVTVEDPVEYQLEGLTQVQVNNKSGLTFASTLRSFLRQDPDVIMVGEIRDLETAKTAVQAAQSGHLVLSTLHTNSSPSTLSRLVLLGVEPHQIASGLLCVVAQRLVRKICEHCRKKVAIKPEHKALLRLSEERRLPGKLFFGGGCEACRWTGYKGRAGLYEILTLTSELKRQMVVDPSEEELWRVAREEGLRTLLEDGLDKVERGMTSLDEVLRVTTIRRTSTQNSPPESLPTVVSSSKAPTLVSEVMIRNVVTLHPTASLAEASRILGFRGINGCPVVDETGRVVGLLSQSDLVAALARGAEELPETVREIMSENIIGLAPDASLSEAAQTMWRHKVHRIVVLHEDRLVGILTPFDLMVHSNLFK